MNFKEMLTAEYWVNRITKKEISTFAGVILMLAGPMGWASAEHIALAKTILTASGLIDPGTGAGSLMAAGAALVAIKEKS